MTRRLVPPIKVPRVPRAARPPMPDFSGVVLKEDGLIGKKLGKKIKDLRPSIALDPNLNMKLKMSMGDYRVPTFYDKVEFFKARDQWNKTMHELIQKKLQSRASAGPLKSRYKISIATRLWLKEKGLSLNDPWGALEYLHRQNIKERTIFHEMIEDPDFYIDNFT